MFTEIISECDFNSLFVYDFGWMTLIQNEMPFDRSV